MTRGQTVRRVCLYDIYLFFFLFFFVKKKDLHLHYWDLIRINTVKHTNQKGELRCCVLPEHGHSASMHSVKLHAAEQKLYLDQHL